MTAITKKILRITETMLHKSKMKIVHLLHQQKVSQFTPSNWYSRNVLLFL